MKISVIIPVYNGERYIETCLSSLLQQTYQDWEAVLVDDGSTDNSLSILQQFSNIDSRFLVHSQKNSGVAISRNKGIHMATGSYVTFLDVDDTLATNCLEKFIAQFEQDVDIVVSSFCIMKRNKIINRKVLKAGVFDKVEYLKKVLSGICGWELCAKMYRRKLFDNSIIIPENIRIGEDASVYIQLVSHSCKVKVINIPLYNYIQHSSSVSHQKSIKLAEETIEAACFIERYLQSMVFYDSISKYLDSMFLLFYSNSTRRYYLGKHHWLMKRVRSHFSVFSFLSIPWYKSIYVLCSYYGGYWLNLLCCNYKKIDK